MPTPVYTLETLPTKPAAGDLILFGGRGLESTIIKWLSDRTNHAISHVGVMISDVALVESTTLNGQSGVCVSILSDRVGTYKGEMWVRYLNSQAHSALHMYGGVNSERMVGFLLGQVGRGYDKRQAILSLFGWSTPELYGTEPSWYCSEVVTTGYIEGGILPPGSKTDLTPSALAKLPIFLDQALQILGSPKELKF